MGPLRFHLVCAMIACSAAGPVGDIRRHRVNATADGGCIVGDLVYTVEEEFPGSSPCERCRCGEDGAVRCSRVECEPRAGCRAIHRPDRCCPAYQCECERDGRVYGNGEKLVDATEPCRVCYCQGGEVVCRKVACFLRDDCEPRPVPGRCCPEYDDCPIRGVTSLAGLAPSADRDEATTPPARASPDDVKQQITIKEITPISEIPIIGGVRVEVEDVSSKSPLTARDTAAPPLPVAAVGRITSTPDTRAPSPARTSASPTVAAAAATKTSLMDDEDPSLLDHNPAFPPIPDDLSVLSDRGDEIGPERDEDDARSSTRDAREPAATRETTDDGVRVAGGSDLENSPMLNLRADILDASSSFPEDANEGEDAPLLAPSGPLAVSPTRNGVDATRESNATHPTPSMNDPIVSRPRANGAVDRSDVATEKVTFASETSSLPIETNVSTGRTALSTPRLVASAPATDVVTRQRTRENDALADLIDLVGDVASMSDHTGDPPRSSAVDDRLPNSIAERPPDDERARVEIEDEDEATVADASPPNDTVEPTTERRVIDDVTDDENIGNGTIKNEVDIIAQSYVPAIDRRPTRVLMNETTAAI